VPTATSSLDENQHQQRLLPGHSSRIVADDLDDLDDLDGPKVMHRSAAGRPAARRRA
jgi:hypothetical protein